MIAFRDRFTREIGATLVVHRHEEAIAAGANPWTWGTIKCCAATPVQVTAPFAIEVGQASACGAISPVEQPFRLPCPHSWWHALVGQASA
jgi:sulfate adenylyltransferase subunit 2